VIRRAPLLAVLVAAAGALALAGCTPTISVTPAPGATATACAALVVRLPATLGSAAKRQTDSQGTAAWGDREAVQLQCGVAPPGPTTDACFTVGGVDWIRLDRGTGTDARVVLTTFGRTPATRLEVDPSRISVSDVLPSVSDAVVAAMPSATRHCTAASAAPTPSATP